MVVVMNKIDVMSATVGAEGKMNGPTSTTKNGSRDQLTMTNLPMDNQQSDAFLCREMVESLVTCDWGHGFVSASAKDNINVVQVYRIYRKITRDLILIRLMRIEHVMVIDRH